MLRLIDLKHNFIHAAMAVLGLLAVWAFFSRAAGAVLQSRCASFSLWWLSGCGASALGREAPVAAEQFSAAVAGSRAQAP